MSELNYEKYEELVMNSIYEIRVSKSDEEQFLDKKFLEKGLDNIFGYKEEQFDDLEFIYERVEVIYADVIKKIVFDLSHKKGIKMTESYPVDKNNNREIMDEFKSTKNSPLFALIKIDNKIKDMYIFKKVGIGYRILDTDKKLKEYFSKRGIKNFYYVSMEGNSVLNENLAMNRYDPSSRKGDSNWSMEDFFVSNFGTDEYEAFKLFISAINKRIKSHISFVVSSTLATGHFLSYKNKIQKRFIKYDAYQCVKEILNKEDAIAISTKLIANEYFTALFNPNELYTRFKISGCDYSSSFLTAEWMYDTLISIGKVDYSPIVMSYCKTVEQLLFAYVSTWANKGKLIGIKRKISLDNRTIEAKSHEVMLGDMKAFLEDNNELFSDLKYKDAIIDEIRKIIKYRNACSHKNNMYDLDTIKEIRKHVIAALTLILGVMIIDEDGEQLLGIKRRRRSFTALCEYLYMHRDSPYKFVCENTDIGKVYYYKDSDMNYEQDGTLNFSRIVFREMTYGETSGNVITFDEKTIPKKIGKGSHILDGRGIFIGGPWITIWDEGLSNFALFD